VIVHISKLIFYILQSYVPIEKHHSVLLGNPSDIINNVPHQGFSVYIPAL
jgi:hypothetical protein